MHTLAPTECPKCGHRDQPYTVRLEPVGGRGVNPGDTDRAAALLADADRALAQLIDDGRDWKVSTDYGLLAVARHDLELALEALELRQRFGPRTGP